MQTGDLPSTSVNFGCGRETFCKFLSTFRTDRRASINFLCGRETFRQLPSTFCVTGIPFVNFRQHSVRPGDFPSATPNFQCCQKFRQLPSTFRVVIRPSVNILCAQETYRILPSTFYSDGRPFSIFVNFLCGRETICLLPSSFCATERLSVNFRQLSFWPRDLTWTSVNFLHRWEGFRQLSVRPGQPFVIYCRSLGRTERWQNLTESLLATRWVDGSLWKVSRLHVKLTEFMEGITAARKVDRRWQKVSLNKDHRLFYEIGVVQPGWTAGTTEKLNEQGWSSSTQPNSLKYTVL